MTREVLDVLPTGRNIQAVGIMIPGTALALGGGGALSRDVGGSGQLQQSPLQYRGSGDTVQTIEGLAAQQPLRPGRSTAASTGTTRASRKSATSPAPTPPRWARAACASTWCRATAATRSAVRSSATYAGESGRPTTAARRVIGLAVHARNLTGSTTFNPNNRLTNVDEIQKIWDFNPSIGGPIKRDKLWFHYTFRHWGVEKTVADSYFDRNPSPFVYDAGHRSARASTMATSSATRCGCRGRQPARTSSPSITTTSAKYREPLGHQLRPCRPRRRACR